MEEEEREDREETSNNVRKQLGILGRARSFDNKICIAMRTTTTNMSPLM